MKSRFTPIYRAMCLTAVFTTVGCINEDLSDCGTDMDVQYNLELQLNLETELRTELNTETEQQMAGRLEEALSPVFTTQAQSIDLNFFNFDTQVTERHEAHEINSDEASFTLYVKPQHYSHAAIANTAAPGAIRYTGSEAYSQLRIEQERGDTIDGHTTGLFSQTLDMNVTGQTSQSLSLTLPMRNCASALVLTPDADAVPEDIRVCVCDMATAYAPAHDSYDYTAPAVIRTQRIDAADLAGFYAVSFPSPEEPAARTRADVGTENGVWRMEVWVKMPDGKTTKSTLHIQKALPAGHIKVVKGHINSQGEVVPSSRDVGVSVQLDWKPGGNHEVEM